MASGLVVEDEGGFLGAKSSATPGRVRARPKYLMGGERVRG